MAHNLTTALTAGIQSLATRQITDAHDMDTRIAAAKVIADYAAKLVRSLEEDHAADIAAEDAFEAAMAEAEARARWNAQIDAEVDFYDRHPEERWA